MEGEQLRNRTKEFAHRCIKVALALPDTPLGRHVRGQLIPCSTSVASNYRAACISKISIVLEEADEFYFWLEFIIDEGLLKKDLVEPLLKEAAELTSLFMASRKTARGKRTNL
jgi:four helix bundle protein